MLRSVSMVATRRASVASSRVGVRSLGGYVQPPLSQGKGGKDGVIPTDEDQATGREREELKAFAKGQEYFNRQPIKAAKGQGTFQNPIMIPSQESSRIVGQVPKGQVRSPSPRGGVRGCARRETDARRRTARSGSRSRTRACTTARTSACTTSCTTR